MIELSLLAVALAIPGGALILRSAAERRAKRAESEVEVERDARDWLIRDRLRQKVVVTLKSRASFSGVLFEVDDRSYVLRNAQALDPGGAGVVPVDGEVVLARADIEFLQRP